MGPCDGESHAVESRRSYRLLQRGEALFARRLALAACAIALLIAAPAGAAPLSCGDVITKDTTHHADLVGCPGDGLVIGADGITLDLNGHSIEGSGIGSGPDIVYGDTRNGIDNTAEHSAVTVENGKVGHFEVGVKLYDADANHITGLEL